MAELGLVANHTADLCGCAYTRGYFRRVIVSFKQTPTKTKHTQAGVSHSLGVLCFAACAGTSEKIVIKVIAWHSMAGIV